MSPSFGTFDRTRGRECGCIVDHACEHERPRTPSQDWESQYEGMLRPGRSEGVFRPRRYFPRPGRTYAPRSTPQQDFAVPYEEDDK